MDEGPVLNGLPDEIDLPTGADIADPRGAHRDAILRRVVEDAAYNSQRPEIRAVSSPRLEHDVLRAAAWELLRRADKASRAARQEELQRP